MLYLHGEYKSFLSDPICINSVADFLLPSMRTSFGTIDSRCPLHISDAELLPPNEIDGSDASTVIIGIPDWSLKKILLDSAYSRRKTIV